MTKKTRREIDAALKAKIALEAVREHAAPALDPKVGVDAEKVAHKQVDDLYAKIGRLTVEQDFLATR